MKVKSDHRSKFSNLRNNLERRIKPEKYQAFDGIRTCDLRDTGAMLDQLSCEATHWEVNLLSSYLPVQWNDVKYFVDESEEWSLQ